MGQLRVESRCEKALCWPHGAWSRRESWSSSSSVKGPHGRFDPLRVTQSLPSQSPLHCTWFAPTSSHFLHFCSDLARTCMVDASADSIADLVLSAYSKLNFRPPEGQFTILAGFVLQNSDSELKLISLGTGSKCLPASRLPVNGDAVHDSHAEVLARRGAVRWLLEEITRSCSTPAESTSPWLCRQSDGKFALKAGTALTMYISTVPCKHVPCLLLVCRCGSLTGTARWRRLHQVLGVVPGSADGRA